MFARYFGYLLTEFDQTFTPNRLWGQGWTIERVKFLGSEGQGSGSRWGQICPKMHFLAL